MIAAQTIKFWFLFFLQAYLIIGFMALILAICVLAITPDYADSSPAEKRKVVQYVASLLFTWPRLVKVVFDLVKRR